jgi:preprotein translocase subunit SecE
MNEQPEAVKTSGLDSAMLGAAIVLVIAGITAYYWFDAQSDWLRAGYVLGGLVLGLLLAGRTELGRNTWSFILSSRNEVRKMVWPSRQETMTTTLFVLFTALVVAILMWMLDLGLFWALRGITGQGS